MAAPAPGLVAETLEECQRSFAVHKRCIQKLKKAYAEHPQELREGVLDAVKRCMLVFKREPAVERLLQFVANLASFSNDKYSSDSELAVDLLDKIIPLTKAKDKAVRFRSCQLTSKLLNSLGEDAEVSDEFYESILNAMLLRLRDKVPVVRVHAASAIARLQDPTDAEDPVTLEYLRLIASDTSKEVRKSVLANIGISTVTLPAILERIRDVRDDVRKYTYNAIHIKLDMKQLQVRQRLEVLECGLMDRTPMVSDACTKMLCDKWLSSNCHGNPVALLQALDVDNSAKLSERALKACLGTSLTSSKGHPLALKNPKQYIPDPKEALSVEGAFYWRVLAQHATDTNNDDLMEAAIPEITTFCEVFRSHVSHPVISSQLLRLSLLLDFGDEMGRRELYTMCGSLLIRLDTDESLVPHLMASLSTMEASHDDFVAFIGEALSTVMSAPPDDDFGHRHCLLRTLNISHELLLSCTKLSQIARISDLVKALVESGVTDTNAEIRDRAVRCLGLFCVLDEVVAAVYLPLLVTVANTDVQDLRSTALSACFDIAMAYRSPEWAALPDSLTVASSDSIFPKLFTHLSSEMPLVRSVAAEGFAKLIISARLRSKASIEKEALTALALLYFSPHSDDETSLRQCLAIFFPTFIRRSPSSVHLVESVFLACLRHVIHAPKTCSLSKVSVSQLGQYLLTVIASADVEGSKPIQSASCQERIAVALCNEVLSDPEDSSVKHLIKVLQSCNLSEAGPSVLSSLFGLSCKASKLISDATTASLMVKFGQHVGDLCDVSQSDAPPRDTGDFDSERRAYISLCTDGVWVDMFPAVEAGEDGVAAVRKKGGGGAKRGVGGRAKAAARGGGTKGGKGRKGEEEEDEGREDEDAGGEGSAHMLSPHSPINVRRSTRTRKATVAKVQQDVDKLLAEQERKDKEDWLKRREEGVDEQEEDDEDEEEDDE